MSVAGGRLGIANLPVLLAHSSCCWSYISFHVPILKVPSYLVIKHSFSFVCLLTLFYDCISGGFCRLCFCCFSAGWQHILSELHTEVFLTKNLVCTVILYFLFFIFFHLKLQLLEGVGSSCFAGQTKRVDIIYQ